MGKIVGIGLIAFGVFLWGNGGLFFVVVGVISSLISINEWLAERRTRPGNPRTTAQRRGGEILQCPNCGQQNRVVEERAAGRFLCANCRTPLREVSGPRPQKPSPQNSGTVFRPSNGPCNQSIRFGPVNEPDATARPRDIAGLVDAFTGEPLNSSLGLHECGNCHVYYHASSVSLLNAENSGSCVICGQKKLVAIKTVPDRPTQQPRQFSPTAVTLQNFRSHVGRVITFEGTIQSVKRSRNGQNFGALFENKGWCGSLKILIFRSKVAVVGGEYFIESLTGRQLRVRGLLQHHPKFGYQIIVTERGMIQL